MSLLLKDADVEQWWLKADMDVRKAPEIAVHDLELRAIAGDKEAQHQLNEWTLRGCRDDLKARFTALNQVAVGSNGGRGILPKYFSVRSADGARQLAAWTFMSRAQFEQIVEAYAAQTNTRIGKLGLLRRVLTAWDQHPEAETAGEVARLAGINVADIEIETASA